MTQASLLAGHDLISEQLVAVLSPGQKIASAGQRGTQNSAAHAQYQKGRYAYFRYEPIAFSEALSHFTSATDLNPSFANAYAQQAYCRATLYVFGLPGADKTVETAEALARKTIQTDNTSVLA